MEPNLGRLLVHNFKLNYDNLKLFHFSSCFDLNCKTCIFADSGYFIKFNEYFSIPLYINSSCDTTGIVYVRGFFILENQAKQSKTEFQLISIKSKILCLFHIIKQM